MPWRFVRQPNGLLARFSTVVDNFTGCNLTKERALEIAREVMGRVEAEDEVQLALDDDMEYLSLYSIKVPGPADGLRRWRDAIGTIWWAHGEKVLAETLAEISGGEVVG